MKRKPVRGKFCEWPARWDSTRPCAKPAYVYMTNKSAGRWCCGIHENAGHNQGWVESGSPDEHQQEGTHGLRSNC